MSTIPSQFFSIGDQVVWDYAYPGGFGMTTQIECEVIGFTEERVKVRMLEPNDLQSDMARVRKVKSTSLRPRKTQTRKE